MPRETKDILKDLCRYNLSAANPMDRLPHDCYMILVGRLKLEHHMKMLFRMNEAQGMTTNEEDDPNQAEYAVLNSEEVESIIEHVVLEGTTEQIENQRKSHFVYEDNFNSAIIDLIDKKSSYEQLKRICRIYETRENVDVDAVMEEHENRVRQSYSYFSNKNLPNDEAKALAFSLSFYTGTKSEACNRGASLIARRSNGQILDEDIEKEINEAALILYYMVRALSCIPFYWGYVTRACQLTNDELNLYVPGNLITWIQFSSSKKGKKVVDSDAFKYRNTLFKIFSLTGRPIQQFSNYPEEDEVLFLPHSTFLVFNRKVYYEGGGKQVIYMRQIELGLCQWSVLWVDDHIFDERWENKQHMEYAAIKSIDINVHFIPKSSTSSALSFLRSAFGQRLKNKDTFRIVTDMNRENEDPSHNAGARLIKEIRRMGFNNKCLIFTSNQRHAKRIVEQELDSRERQSLTISTAVEELRSFVNFDHTPSTRAQQSMASNYGASPYNSTTSKDIDSRMMHNPMNTDINILIKAARAKNLVNSPDNCVLLMTGSFNPVHYLHFQNFVRVREFLEHEHQPPWNVLGAYLSPTHDEYVRHKLGEQAWISSEDRCQLSEQAIEFEGPRLSSWISISRGESEWKDGFVDFGPVTENLRDFLNGTLVGPGKTLKYPLRVVYVCGLDHFNKCSYVESMAKQKNMGCAVVYRLGSDEKEISNSARQAGVAYVSLKKERSKISEISSTDIREYFKNPTAAKSNIKQWIYPNVLEYMSKKYQNQ